MSAHGPTCCCDACWHAHPRHVPGGYGFLTGYHSEYMGGEARAEADDEAEMSRDMQYAYDHHHIGGGPQFILTKVKHLPDIEHEPRPRRNVPWRRA